MQALIPPLHGAGQADVAQIVHNERIMARAQPAPALELAEAASDAAAAARAFDEAAPPYDPGAPMDVDRILAAIFRRQIREFGHPPCEVSDELLFHADSFRFPDGALMAKRLCDITNSAVRTGYHLPSRASTFLSAACDSVFEDLDRKYSQQPAFLAMVGRYKRLCEVIAREACDRADAALKGPTEGAGNRHFSVDPGIGEVMRQYLEAVRAVGGDPRSAGFDHVRILIDEIRTLDSDFLAMTQDGFMPSPRFFAEIRRVATQAHTMCTEFAEVCVEPSPAKEALAQFRLARGLERVLHDLHQVAMVTTGKVDWFVA